MNIGTKILRVGALACLASLVACGAEQKVVTTNTGGETKKPDVTAEQKPGEAKADVLGPKPTVGPAKPFTPPTVDTFKTKNGLTVWLVERHGLPLVSASMVLVGGSSADPPDKPGLTNIMTDMLDEGAGKRSAVEVSSAVNDLGATLTAGTNLDASTVSLTVLKNNFNAAFGIFSDVIARPRFDKNEWKRVSELWVNDLKKRSDEPTTVSRVVNAAVFFGPGTAYGHPVDGLLAGAEAIDLDAVKRFYADNVRPDRAVLVVAGDITRKEVTDAVDAQLGAWKAKAGAAKAGDKPKASSAAYERPKIVLVDRPGAPQSVIAVVREGVSATDAAAARLDLVNTALGGSFSSRLNQNLREEHHWAYGAGSGFQEARNPGMFYAVASVETPATGVALKEMLGELQKMSASGITEDEVAKAKAQDVAELMQTYETVSGTSRRLASLARLGLSPTHDAEASRERQGAKLDELSALAKKHVDPTSAAIVIVGPRAEVEPQIEKLGLGKPALWDPEGKPVGEAPAKDAVSKDAAKDAAKKPADKKPAPKK